MQSSEQCEEPPLEQDALFVIQNMADRTDLNGKLVRVTGGIMFTPHETVIVVTSGEKMRIRRTNLLAIASAPPEVVYDETELNATEHPLE